MLAEIELILWRDADSGTQGEDCEDFVMSVGVRVHESLTSKRPRLLAAVTSIA